MGICLRPRVYSMFIATYINMHNTAGKETFRMSVLIMTTAKIKNTAKNNAKDTFTSPDAIGLLHFVLCILSFFASFISFIIYTKEDAKENEINAIMVFNKRLDSNILLLKTNGKNISKFFM